MPVMPSKLLNPTGGWWWHARAWRSLGRWESAIQAMQQEWLQAGPNGQRLVLIGASAGWMFSTDVLLRFKTIETWDIDPWAGRLFDWRHGRELRRHGLQVRHCVGDAWAHESSWLQKDRHSLYWFDNVLGQLRFMLPPDSARQQVQQLKSKLARVAWGSVHDRYSGPLRPNRPVPASWRSRAGVDLNDAVAQSWLQSWGAQDAWLDHLTEQVFSPDTAVLNLAWPFKSDFGHWLEMGWQLP